MKPFYKIGDKITFERANDKFVTTAHIIDMDETAYIVDWINEDGTKETKNDRFTFDDVEHYKSSKGLSWRIIKTVTSILPEDLFTI